MTDYIASTKYVVTTKEYVTDISAKTLRGAMIAANKLHARDLFSVTKICEHIRDNEFKTIATKQGYGSWEKEEDKIDKYHRRGKFAR